MIVNGQQQQHITIADRGVQYGDGCFTTMAFRNSQIEFFDAHIERLKFSCKTLNIQFDKWTELTTCIFSSLRGVSDCVIKVMITRGTGGRGYSPEGASDPNYIVSQHSIPNNYAVWQNKGIKLTVSPIQLAKQPLLAGIKHLNRLEQVFIKQALLETKFDDAVVCDTQQKIIETSVANLFWYKNNHWFTPDLSKSGVQGVMRNQVLAEMCQQGLKCHIVNHDLSELFDAQELFVCNSLMTIVPVTSLVNPLNQQHKSYLKEQTIALKQILLAAIRRKALSVQ
ncbi:MAG: aminodeoxychorismate lyase [Paraglaciecola sp.]|uniref:aminodeoxychorismate lyase n=1 Tax=Paraglaciecola sp. TaxID=1920173 RepID=UPI003299553E